MKILKPIKMGLLPYFVTLSLASNAYALTLFSDSVKPQSSNNSCQSYAAILNLAAQKHPAFKISTFEELREFENEFKNILNSLPGSQYAHKNWAKAMELLTSGHFTFELEYEKDIVKWMKKVKSLTTQSTGLEHIIQVSELRTVMTSVTRLDDSRYPSGHIISVLSVDGDGDGKNSATRLISFNSAIKGTGTTVNYCSPGNQKGEGRCYSN